MPRISAYLKLDPALKARVARHEISTVIPARLLSAFFTGPETFTAEDLAQRANVKRSSVYRWIHTLEEMGWVEPSTIETIRTLGPRERVWRRVHKLQPLQRGVQ